MFFTNKNLNWEITTKDLVTFKLLKDEMKLILKSFAKKQNIERQIG